MTYQYKLNCGQYVLHEGDTPIGRVLDEVSIALDCETGTLHKHGAPEMVARWHQEAQAKFRAAGFHDMAEQLVVVTGRFELEDLNRCLSTSGFAGRLYQKLLQGEANSLPLA